MTARDWMHCLTPSIVSVVGPVVYDRVVAQRMAFDPHAMGGGGAVSIAERHACGQAAESVTATFRS